MLNKTQTFTTSKTQDEIKNLVKEQNGRVRINESAIARIQGVGGIIAIVFSGFIGWLFKLRG